MNSCTHERAAQSRCLFICPPYEVPPLQRGGHRRCARGDLSALGTVAGRSAWSVVKGPVRKFRHKERHGTKETTMTPPE